MNDIFRFHDKLTSRYNDFSEGFNIIRKKDTKAFVYKFFNEQKKFCPEALIQLNMNYEKNHNIHELVKNGSLHKDCGRLLSLAKRSFRGRFTPATGNSLPSSNPSTTTLLPRSLAQVNTDHSVTFLTQCLKIIF